MGITGALILAIGASVAALAAVAVGLGLLIRSRVESREAALPKARQGWRGLVRRPDAWAVAILYVSLALPWITGSVVGLSLPGSVFALPWVRWFVLIPVAVSTGLFVVSLRLTFVGLALIRTALYSAMTILGSLFLVLAAVAQRLSRYGVVLDTVMRGVNHASVLVPVIRVGPGEIVFLGAGLLGCIGTVAMLLVPPSAASGELIDDATTSRAMEGTDDYLDLYGRP
jgi:hypothetical protein